MKKITDEELEDILQNGPDMMNQYWGFRTGHILLANILVELREINEKT